LWKLFLRFKATGDGPYFLGFIFHFLWFLLVDEFNFFPCSIPSGPSRDHKQRLRWTSHEKVLVMARTVCPSRFIGLLRPIVPVLERRFLQFCFLRQYNKLSGIPSPKHLPSRLNGVPFHASEFHWHPFLERFRVALHSVVLMPSFSPLSIQTVCYVLARPASVVHFLLARARFSHNLCLWRSHFTYQFVPGNFVPILCSACLTFTASTSHRWSFEETFFSWPQVPPSGAP